MLKHNCTRKPFFWKIFFLQSNKQHQFPLPPPPSQNLKYHSYSHCGKSCCYDAFTSTAVVVSMSKRIKSFTSIPHLSKGIIMILMHINYMIVHYHSSPMNSQPFTMHNSYCKTITDCTIVEKSSVT